MRSGWTKLATMMLEEFESRWHRFVSLLNCLSKVPISAPLTLLLRGVPSYPFSRTASERENNHVVSSSESEHSEKLSIAEVEAAVYDSGWVFANPNILLDKARGLLWKIHLDLEAIAASSSDILSLLDFLQLRSHETNKAEMIDSEVRSTLNVVEACANMSSVKRMILTSCASTMVFDAQNNKGGKVVDERRWSNLDFSRDNKLWGAVSKTSAEKAAWVLARDRGLDLVVINSATIVGPLSANTTPDSMISHLKIYGVGKRRADASSDIQHGDANPESNHLHYH